MIYHGNKRIKKWKKGGKNKIETERKIELDRHTYVKIAKRGSRGWLGTRATQKVEPALAMPVTEVRSPFGDENKPLRTDGPTASVTYRVAGEEGVIFSQFGFEQNEH